MTSHPVYLHRADLLRLNHEVGTLYLQEFDLELHPASKQDYQATATAYSLLFLSSMGVKTNARGRSSMATNS